MKDNFTLSIGICASKSYQYSLVAQVKSIQQNIFHLSNIDYKGKLILVTDKNPINGILEKYSKLLGNKWEIFHIPLDVKDNNKDYKEQSALTIATLRSSAFCKARELNSDYFLSLDSDVLMGNDNLKFMMWALDCPNNLFEVATCPYPSNGNGRGGDFLCGYGDYQHHIFPDIYENERKIPQRYLNAKNSWEKELQECKDIKDRKKADKLIKKLHWYNEKIKRFPPFGNVFTLNAKSYKKRGWYSNAMPGIGFGCFVESSWCGLGNTLMSKRALELSNFNSYGNLQGTEDLINNFENWKPNGIRICAITHSPSHHVVKDKKTGKLFVAYAYHEKVIKDIEGHLRIKNIPFYAYEETDRFIKEPTTEEVEIIKQ